MKRTHEYCMDIALTEAKKSAESGNYALGALVVKDDKILSIAHTSLHDGCDPSAHAEMNAIRQACKKTGSRYLEGARLYTTQEPCPMCAGVAIRAKMEGIVFGAYTQEALEYQQKRHGGGKFSWRQIDISAAYVASKGTPELSVVGGVRRDECIQLYDFST